MKDTIRRIIIAMSCIALGISCVCCQKDETSPLVGTAWECLEEPDIIVFSDNHAGIYYCKSATDGVYDEVYSSFDFSYEVSGKDINVHVFFSRFDTSYSFVMEDDESLTCGVFHWKKIQHKKYQPNQ